MAYMQGRAVSEGCLVIFSPLMPQSPTSRHHLEQNLGVILPNTSRQIWKWSVQSISFE